MLFGKLGCQIPQIGSTPNKHRWGREGVSKEINAAVRAERFGSRGE